MLELYIIRHGLAGKRLEDKALDDERSLKKRGKEKVKEIAKGLKELKVTFDLIITSPLPRAKETAEILKDYCSDSEEIIVTDFLKPEASFAGLIKFLNVHKELHTIAIVGHEPFLSSFASYCLTKNKSSVINLKKGGVLKLEMEEAIKPGECVLAWLMEPHQLILETACK